MFGVTVIQTCEVPVSTNNKDILTQKGIVLHCLILMSGSESH